MPTAPRQLPAIGAAVLAISVLASASDVSAQSDLTAERRAELTHLLRQDCGACHGLRLTGGLGPALTPERLAGRSLSGLTQTILNGVPDTPMPPWDRYLTRDEAAWLARQLKKGR